MQFNQADLDSCNRVGVDEHLIKFKSSPNFKNMKKFIKSRSETTVGSKTVMLSNPYHTPQINVGNMDNMQYLRPDWHKPEIQPPLPLDPPPTDDIIPNFQVKQELVDKDYEFEATPNLPPPENHQMIENTDNINDHPSKICRDFIRGTCKRERTCKYAHKYDLSQLEGVYTFCRKFQNSVCTFTNCKYVHATIFEEQHFYRTGMLPAHALQHRVHNILPPPPPPPPPVSDIVMPMRMSFPNPPPPLPAPNEIGRRMISCVSSMETIHYMEQQDNQIPYGNTNISSSLKREWGNHIETVAAPPCVFANEPMSKKCSHCIIMEFRMNHHRNKVKRALQSRHRMKSQLAAAEHQCTKLRNLVMDFLKPSALLETLLECPGITNRRRSTRGDD